MPQATQVLGFGVDILSPRPQEDEDGVDDAWCVTFYQQDETELTGTFDHPYTANPLTILIAGVPVMVAIASVLGLGTLLGLAWRTVRS